MNDDYTKISNEHSTVLADDKRFSVIDAAKILGIQRPNLFKVLKRLGIPTIKERNSAHRGQSIAYITSDDLHRLKEHFRSPVGTGVVSEDNTVSTEFGWFYLIQLEPEHDPLRFKVGFTVSMAERLRHLRCSAPFAKVLDKWRCKLLWEKTAIDCVTRGCQQIHTEVFRSNSIEKIKELCQAFFKLMDE
ncbi:MAG: hypothetical protein EHM48_10115 [Planctomycetaceae bacterium]|nr:MAG: hypothetical protein EHM48_10115 [Planctomycetaceae bacterium]